MHELLIEPLKYYDTVGKSAYEENSKARFQELLAKSGVNVEENRATVKKYKDELEVINGLAKIVNKFRIYKVLLIIGIIAGVIIFFTSINLFFDSVGGGVALLLLGCGLVAGGIFLLVKKVNPTIKSTNSVKEQHERVAQDIQQQAWAQMAPFNALFRDDEPIRLIEKTIPEFTFDDRFTKEQEYYFIKDYGFVDLQHDEASMIDTLSGRFAGNPFLFGRRRVHSMGDHTYHGTLVITWVETYRDSDGNLRTRNRTQTLHASVIKPKPYFYTNTFLAYGNQAAPNLNFTRESTHAEDLSERALERKIRRGENKLQKKAEKAMKQGGSFQEMANSEFDVLFGATDRDNEVEFRLMYTPLAQRNTVDLIKDKNNFGDDFDFTKYGKFNLITSDHAQSWQMNSSAGNYYSYDVDQIYSNFINFNNSYFKSIFFDFAPLLSVPAYLEEPCASLEDYDNYYYNYTYYEHEVMANAAGYENFVHEDSTTEAILKTNFIKKNGEIDKISVTAYSYTTFDRVDFIPVLGGDGFIHDVPVPWIEYIPVVKTSNAAIGNSMTDRGDGAVSLHGLNIYRL